MSPRSSFVLLLTAAFVTAGCTMPGPTVEVGSLTMAPDATAHLLLNMSLGAGDATVQAEIIDDGGLTIVLPGSFHAANGTVSGWIGVTAGAASGSHDVAVALSTNGGTSRTATFTVEVADPTDALQQGDVALVDLVLRTQDGTVAFTNQPDVEASALPLATGYQSPPAAHEPMPLQLSPQSGLPPALLDALAGTGIGHSVTTTLPELYGPTTLEEEIARDEQLQRDTTLDRFEELPREMAEMQGLINEQTQEGDLLGLPGPWDYRVETLGHETIRLEVALQDGDTVALHNAWPDGSQVTDITESMVIIRTTPPVPVGESFTWNPSWPDASQVVSLDDEWIIVRHSPTEGLSYQEPDQQGGQALVTVQSVEEETITLARSNSHPLAGQDIYVEMTVLGRQDPGPMMG